MSDPTAAEEQEMAERMLDGQIADYEEEKWQRRNAARWPTAMEYDQHLDGVGPPEEVPA